MRRLLLPAAAVLVALSTTWFAGCDETTAPPSRLSLQVVSGDGQQGVVGRTLVDPLVIKATDAKGRTLRNLPVEFRVTSGGGFVAPVTTTTDNRGFAQTSWTLGTSTAAAQRIEAHAISTNQLLGSFTATALPDAPSQLLYSAGDSQAAPVRSAVPIRPAVIVQDQYANPVPGITVSFVVTQGGGSISGSPATSDATGLATVGSWSVGSALGPNQLVAAVGLNVAPYVFNATATLGTGARMVAYAGANQVSKINAGVPAPPAVRVTDANGLPIQGVHPTWAGVQGGGSLATNEPFTTANGVADLAYWKQCCTRGVYIIRATVPDLVDTVFFTTMAEATAPATIAVQAGNGQTAITNTAVAIAPAAVVRDTFNNPVPHVAVDFIVTDGGGSVSGITPFTTDTNGVATVGAWMLGAEPGANALSATAAGVGAGTMFSATAIPRPASPSRSTVSAAPTSIAASAGANLSTITVTARDENGVAISGTTVILSVSGSGNTITQPAASTDANGVATGTLSSTVAGSKTVSARIRDVNVNQTATVTVTAAAPAQITIVKGNNQTAGVETAVLTPPTVAVRDAFNNAVSGAGVLFEVASGGGTVSGPNPVLTNSVGQAAITWIMGDVPGTNTLNATVQSDGVAGNPVTFSATAVTEFWTRLANMPTPRQDLAAGAVNGKLYAVGGITIGSYGADPTNGTVEEYDPATNTWTRKASMPTARASFAIGVVNGVLYAVGGWGNGPNNIVAAVEAYDPATDTWTAKAPLPTPRYELAVAVVDGILYAIGGFKHVDCVPPPEFPYCNEYEVVGTVEAYDPVTDTWTQKADMPTPRLDFGAAAINGIVYVVGGQRPGVNSWLSSVEAYDPVTNTWMAKAPMPTARFGHSVGVIDGILYAAGGEVPNAGTAVNEAYDPATDSWTTRVPMLEWRREYGGAVIGSWFYAVGGSSSSSSGWRENILDAYRRK